MTSFGDRLKNLREKKGLSQQELAKRFNLSQSTIAYYENDKKQPNQNTLQRLADFFEVSVDYLLGRTDDPTPPQRQKIMVAGKEIELSREEFKVFEEIRKHSILFNDLATDPERKVKQLIRMWETIKTVVEEEEKGREDIIED